MKNALSVDLEEWFSGHILARGISRTDWNKQELRVNEVTRKLLRILERHQTKATFFVLGWLAERVPGLVKEIEDAGHEIASHGYSHTSITEMTPEEFEDDLKKSLDAIGVCVKQKILGYRAPSFTVTRKTLWALDALARQGFQYDSSVFPISFHPDYGIPDAPLSIYRIHERLIEVPLSCVEILGQRVPCGGGFYFRFYPYQLTRRLLQRCNREGRPAVFYLHPWELDPDQPKVNLGGLNTVRHYYNISRIPDRLNRLLEDFEFTTVRQVIGL